MGFFDSIKKSIEEGAKKLSEVTVDDIKKAGEDLIDDIKKTANEYSENLSEIDIDKVTSNIKENIDKAVESSSQTLSEIQEASAQKLAEIQEASAQKFTEISEATSQKIEELQVAGSELYDKATDYAEETALKLGETINDGIEKVSEITLDDVTDTAIRGAKLVSGVQAYEDREKANELMETANKLKDEIERENEKRRIESNEILEDFGKTRLTSLQSTIGVYIEYMKRLQKNLKDKDYEISACIDIKPEEIKELETVEMNASEAIKTTMAVGTVAGVALAGVPVAVTSVVGALAAASTGTAISSLSGAAATNATLAWLGGGAISAGGGGIAAGTAVLTGITYAATGIFALAAAGIIAGAHYSKKHTEATEYLAQIQEYKAKMEVAWTAMEGVNQRAKELKDLTLELKARIETQLNILAPLIDQFDKENEEHMKVLQQATIMVKSMSEMSQIPLLDDNGGVSEQSGLVKGKVEKILNKNL